MPWRSCPACTRLARSGPLLSRPWCWRPGDGAVVITGCAHPGVVNIVREAQAVAGPKIALLAGGFHLGDTSESKLPLIVAEVRQAGVSRVMPSHCTGKKAIALFRSEYGENYVEGGVGRTVAFSTK